MRKKLEKIAGLLKEKKLTVACAESLTAGQISSALTYLPGSSEYFSGGIVAYSNQLKVELLGVGMDTILQHGAVSRQCADEMALGVKRKLGVDVAVSSTGIAGPSGGSVKKPVGTVWLGACLNDHVESRHFVFEGDRHEITRQSVQEALNLLLEIIHLQ